MFLGNKKETSVVWCGDVGQYLPRGLDTFPQAEVEDEDNQNQTQGQLPARQTQIVDSFTLVEMQYSPST